MIKKFFSVGLRGKLENEIQWHLKFHHPFKREVTCWITMVRGNKYQFNANLATSLSHGPFYTSGNYQTLREALLALTQEVAESSRFVPSVTFFRGICLCSRELVHNYLLQYGNIEDKHSWLTNATSCPLNEQEFRLIELFDGEAWKPAAQQFIEFSDLHPDHLLYLLEEAFHPLMCDVDYSEDESKLQFVIIDPSSDKEIYNMSPTPFFLLQRKADFEKMLSMVRSRVQQEGYILSKLRLDYDNDDWMDV